MLVFAYFVVLPMLMPSDEINEKEPNDTPLDAQKIMNGNIISGSLTYDTGTSGDLVDYYLIESINSGVGLIGQLRSSASNSDFDLYLYHEDDLEKPVSASSTTDSPEESLGYKTVDGGNYYFAVRAYYGNGTYKLTIFTQPASGIIQDDNNRMEDADSISLGVPLTDTVDRYLDPDDYYKVNVGANKYIIASLTVPDRSDFDLYIYNSSSQSDDDWHQYTMSYFGGNYMEAASKQPYGGEFLNIPVATADTFYINVFAYRGSGAYTLTVDVVNSIPVDDTDQGHPATAPDKTSTLADESETITGSLDSFNDFDDYYRLDLDSGQTLTTKLSVPEDMDFDLYIYDSNYKVVAMANDTTRLEVLYLTVTDSQTYYVNPWAYMGTGDYQLDLFLSGGSGWPIANAGAGKPDERVDIPIIFDGSGSLDNPGGGIQSYAWDFGDGNSSTVGKPTHSYTEAGTYIVTLTVKDSEGVADASGATHVTTDTITVTVLPAGGKKYALVIGISDYTDSSNAIGIKDLSYADDDALAWQEYLEDNGYEVVMLLDEDATYARIMQEIGTMRDKEKAGDYVAFTFSGHGATWQEGGYVDWSDEHSLLLASDAVGGTNSVTDTGLRDAFKDFDSDHIFFFFDSCRSGGMDEMGGAGRMVIQASGAKEYALDSGRYQSGLWTYWFLSVGVLKERNPILEDAFYAVETRAIEGAAQYESSTHPEMYDGDITEGFVL